MDIFTGKKVARALPVILITGRPGVGKTTLIRKWAEEASDLAGGFYTREIRRDGGRIGFEIITFDGDTVLLAKKSPKPCFEREVRFKHYRVNVGGIEDTAVASLIRARKEGRIIFADEIGPMECFSEVFRGTIRLLLDDPNARMIGSVVKRPHPFADEVKRHPRVKLIEVTNENRDALARRFKEINSAGDKESR